jgi:hypothetical protein
MVAAGRSRTETAELLGVCRKTIAAWVRRHREGEDGSLLRGRGRPRRRADAELEKKLPIGQKAWTVLEIWEDEPGEISRVHSFTTVRRHLELSGLPTRDEFKREIRNHLGSPLPNVKGKLVRWCSIRELAPNQFANWNTRGVRRFVTYAVSNKGEVCFALAPEDKLNRAVKNVLTAVPQKRHRPVVIHAPRLPVYEMWQRLRKRLKKGGSMFDNIYNLPPEFHLVPVRQNTSQWQ